MAQNQTRHNVIESGKSAEPEVAPADTAKTLALPDEASAVGKAPAQENIGLEGAEAKKFIRDVLSLETLEPSEVAPAIEEEPPIDRPDLLAPLLPLIARYQDTGAFAEHLVITVKTPTLVEVSTRRLQDGFIELVAIGYSIQSALAMVPAELSKLKGIAV